MVRAPLETKHALNSFASSTPATDGQLIYVSFLEVDGHTIPAPNVSNVRPVTPGKMVVAAYDLSGKQQWLVRAGEFISAHGYCASPVLFEDLVILNGDHDGDGYIVALKKATGEKVWSTPREHKTRSYVTPIIRDSGRPHAARLLRQQVRRQPQPARRLDALVDRRADRAVRGLDGRSTASCSSWPRLSRLSRARHPPGRHGQRDRTHVAWHETSAKCYVPSPVVAGGHLIVADDRGTANCFVAATGERLWQERLGNHFSGSLVDGRRPRLSHRRRRRDESRAARPQAGSRRREPAGRVLLFVAGHLAGPDFHPRREAFDLRWQGEWSE